MSLKLLGNGHINNILWSDRMKCASQKSFNILSIKIKVSFKFSVFFIDFNFEMDLYVFFLKLISNVWIEDGKMKNHQFRGTIGCTVYTNGWQPL